MKNNNEGITLIDILKILWKRKIFIGIFTVVSIITIILIVIFGINPNKIQYKAEFELSHLYKQSINENGEIETSYDTLPSGTVFHYKDFINEETLDKIISSNEKYSFMDAKSILKNNNVSISKTREYDGIKDVPARYMITISGLGNHKQEIYASFVEDIMKNVVNEINKDFETLSYSSKIAKFDNYNSYYYSLPYLNSLLDELIDKYEILIAHNSEGFLVNGKTLQTYLNEVNSFKSINSIDGLLAISKENFYVKNLASFNNEKEYKLPSLRNIYARNLLVIDSYTKVYQNIINGVDSNSTESVDAIIDKLLVLANENVILMDEINFLSGYNPINNTYNTFSTNEEFEEKVNKELEKVEQLMRTYELNEIEISKNKTSVTYDNTSIVVQSGKTSIVITIALGLIIGLFFSSVISLIIELPRTRKKEEKEEI